jgi:xylan 1,4-beta-xylosidase
MYSSYTAASFARKLDLAERAGVNLEGVMTWAFEFEDQPYFAGFRALATNGIDLPVLNVFRMFSLMGGRRVAVESTGEVGLEAILMRGVRDAPDVSALAARDGGSVTVLVWHYHDDDVPGPDAEVALDVRGLPAAAGTVLLHHYRIDRHHGNAFEAWKRMGSPQHPTSDQLAELGRSSRLSLLDSPEWLRPEGGTLRLRMALPRQGVSLLRLEPRPAPVDAPKGR